jgi:hypothetical protein
MADTSGSLLLRAGIVGPAEVAAAHKLRQREGGSFGECLVRTGALDEEQLVEFYHKRLMIPRIDEHRLQIVSPKVLSLVPPEMCAEFRVVPIDVDADGGITLAMADPSDNHAVDEVAFFAERFVIRAVASESAVRRAIESHYGVRFTSPRASEKLPGAPATPKREPIAPQPERKEPSQVVLLTKVKHSDATPLPRPLPPPPVEDNAPHTTPEETSEPILLTKPVAKARGKHDTNPGMAPPVPNPPLGELRACDDRDLISQVVLDYVALLTRRTIFFVIRKSILVGHDARGPGIDAQAITQLAVNLEVPSIFRDVINSRLPYRGPLPESPVNRAFAQALGGTSGEVLLMPIAVRDRIIAVLFADGATLPLPDAALHATTREAGLAYERLILERRR